MIDEPFLIEFKKITEAYWQKWPIYGFQHPRGALWCTGLSNEKIEEYERTLGVRFPDDFRLMLRYMNGTYYPEGTIDRFADYRKAPAAFIYSYPRDIVEIRKSIADLELPDMFPYIQDTLLDYGYELEDGAGFVPIIGHRFVVCGSDPQNSSVLSIVGSDAIVCGDDLQEYPVKEFLPSK